MGAGWFWNAAYIRADDQRKFIAQVDETLRHLTQNQMAFATDDVFADRKLSRLGEAWLASVSPARNGWIGFWNTSSIFCSWVFRTDKLSGIILASEAPGTWDYSIWEDGQIVSWFVSDPKMHFMEWTTEAIEWFVLPYLGSKGFDLDLSGLSNWTKQTIMKDFIEDHQSAFEPNTEILRGYVWPNVSVSVLREWHQLSSEEAVNHSPSIMQIPYLGVRYDVGNLCALLDIRRGFGSLEDLSFLFDQEADTLRWTLREAQEVLSEFEYLIFDYLVEGVSIYQELAYLFSPL